MMTGEQYKNSLCDGRRIYQDGKLVADMDTDPLLAPALDAVAAGYDEYYRPDSDAVNPLVEAPRTVEELRDRVPILTSMDLLLNVTYQSLMTLVVAAARLADTHPEFVARINAYVAQARRDDIRIAECITDSKGDRSKAPAAQDDADQYVRVVERRDNGVVIRGAKLHISAAPFAHHLMVMPTKSMKPGEEDYAIACAVPVNAAGVHVISRTVQARGGDERDYPVSARRSMPDGFVIFDDVFVPHEHVFLDGVAARAGIFAHSLGLWERLGGTAVMVEQADEMVGLAQLMAEANGTARVSHIREKIDEMMIHATNLRAGMEAAISTAHSTPEGYYYPDDLYTNATKYLGAANFNLMVRHLHDIAGGGVITTPSMADLDNPDIGPQLRKYLTGASDVSGDARAKLFHTIRDTTADSYGGWHLVTNVQSGGGLFAQRLVTRKHYDMERAKRLARHAANLD
ncbi:4-hydroxyphenylacetate 3-hydroxylase [Mycobacterium intracellulare]|uniref:4-hydroxyphenylacetate 3-hydroxylase N-terminal domain-containing protein n=1 Tax=Mycobacterium intracellulare TaxID=1767 RepID=UPI001CD9D5D8|nr:4-hydroxyphenylacetate 3-hydroxylase N-terminal domain-containing protein [Mycobacterium intracellulare]MCA2305162.1 4-hydroxyphenylacetate 3-hydroxylase [Mycobacterium intracellulare]MCA2347476.1 4-hydroxyphenylacetate 3-hydroxylase [Mycobacterium intracellulare]